MTFGVQRASSGDDCIAGVEHYTTWTEDPGEERE